jgi:DNA-directed RNA polymerase specialized sigma24 family protein
MEGAAQSRWELTPDALAKLLAKLALDPDVAGNKYEELRRRLIKFFEWRGTHFPDELADETINRLARKIDEGTEIEKNVIALALGIARFVFLESLKDPSSRRAEMDCLSPLAAPPDNRAEDDNTWLVCLRECLASMPEESRELIIEYYEDERRAKIDNRKTLAATLGISLNALFSRAKRVRDSLEQCVTRCVNGK